MENPLKKYLIINSAFSGFSGLILWLFSIELNEIFNISNDMVFPIVGVNLLAFSVFVWTVSQKKPLNKTQVTFISILDFFWVAGSFVLVIFGLFGISKNGNILIIAVAIWIAFLAYKQIKNNK